MKQEKQPIMIEDLLRLKRAERPPAEFWAQFETELRAKQLAALVEKRPWWRTLALPHVFSSVRRYQLPLGATAVLAVTLLAVRDYRTGRTEMAAHESAALTAVARAATMAPAMVVSEAAPEGMAAAAELSSPQNAPVVANADLVAPEGLSRVIGGAEVAAAAELTPSARMIAENLATVQSLAASSRSLLQPAGGFEARAMPARSATIEPLAQMTTPADARRAKLLSAMATSYANDNPSRATERVARRLSDDRLLQDAAHRFDARGNSVALKF